MVSLQSNMGFKIFNSKMYSIRARQNSALEFSRLNFKAFYHPYYNKIKTSCILELEHIEI